MSNVCEDIGTLVFGSLILLVLAFAVTLGIGLALKLLQMI